MYINKIDELIDNILDDFYNKIILKKDMSKYLNETNFVKYQLELNKIFVDYINTLDIEEIKEILKDGENSKKILELIKRYLCYYIFMTFAFFYSGKLELFINNIVEFTKNQPGFNFKVDNFFNSESNGTVIKFYTLLKNIYLLVESDSVKLSNLQKRKDFAEAVRFLDTIGEKVVEAGFKIKNLGGNVKDQCHNIVKSVIYFELYFKEDKKNVQDFLNKTEETKGEFIYIDIVVPNNDFIDFNMIETALPKINVEKGLANEIYDMITQEDTLSKGLNSDDKINELLNSGLIVPIAEDFLLYHKETEKYDRNTSSNPNLAKKHDDTKIKYIINKIDNVTEYFSENTKNKENIKEEIKKLFYVPLNDRRAILINTYEDLNIITKLINQGRRAIENNEYFNDFTNYMQYPYINFKDFSNEGFTIIPNKTIDIIRSISFEKVNQSNINKSLQFRVGNMYPVNVTGFFIPPVGTHSRCLRLKDTVDIRKIGYKSGDNIKKNENGYSNSLNIIRKNISTPSTKFRPGFVWLFDKEKDKVKFDTYDNSSKASPSEYIRLMMSQFYDDLMENISNEVLKLINKRKSITLQEFNKLIYKVDKIIPFPRDSQFYSKIEELVYYDKYFRTEDKYDKKDDEFPGIVGEIINLPSLKPPKKPKISTLKIQKPKITKQITDLESMEAETIGAICQHNITWDNITAIRKKNPNKSSEMLFEFFQQYVVQNNEDDYICKSCGTQINLKNYVLDGTYDDDGRFVSFNMPLEIPIEDIPEYEKYRASIRNMEKDIDRIASICNINTLSGTSFVIRGRVKKIVKDAIDLILIHNNSLKNIYKERSEKIGIYGLSKELSNLFIFELENNIFVYSSKDKDHYKPIKRNNITSYLTLLILLELNDSQIYYMTGDKLCNYYLFSKYGINWFSGLNIRKNNQNTVAPMLNYKVLCYIIFYMSCLITKYNLWKFDIDTEERKKKFDPNVQKVVIHTLVDIINSILEMYSKKKHHYIYDIIANKFFQKLSTTFKNDTILDRIRQFEDKKQKAKSDDKVKSNKGQIIPLKGSYEHENITGISEWLCCKLAKYFTSKKTSPLTNYYNISHITNCPTGKFHKWVAKSGKLLCQLCGQVGLEKSPENISDKKIEENYEAQKLQKLGKKYCKSGKLHTFVYNSKKQCNICSNCDMYDNAELTHSQLTELKSVIQEVNTVPVEKVKEQKYDDDYIKELKAQYAETKTHKEDYYKFINIFISKLEAILGKDTNFHNKNIYLKSNSYTINHDHNGFTIDKPYTIRDDGNIMNMRKDHQFFKKDVIYYTNFKLGVDVFYDATTKLLLGYKEKNKEYQYAKVLNVHLKVNKSIMNILKSLGYPSKYINIVEQMQYYDNLFNDEKVSLNNVISDISRDRIKNLKRFLTDLQRCIYRVSYGFTGPVIDKENNPYQFLEGYRNKLENLVLKDKGDKFLKHWEDVNYNIFHEDIGNKNLNIDPKSKYLDNEDISLYDYSGNIILFYIVNEMNKLLEFNSDKFVKSTLAYLLLDIIINVSNEFDLEKEQTMSETKRFKYILDIYDEREIESIGGMVEGIYEEYVDPEAPVDEEQQEKETDDVEADEALDMEEPEEFDNVEYESGLNCDC